MNLPNFKDILTIVLGKLSVFRNNISLLVSVIIALAGILLFIPTQLLSSGLKKEIQQESIEKLANKIKTLERNPVSEEQLKTAQENLNTVTKEANSIDILAVQTTQRQLLSYDIFHLDPNDANSTISQSIFYQFGRQYCSSIDEFINEHNARLCPTDQEIQNELKESGITNLIQPMMVRSFNSSSSSQENIEGVMVDEICQKRAQSSFVYINPMQISGYEFWKQYSYSSWDEDIENCWYSQLGYWVIEDMFETIVAMNKGHDSLVTAPVKRLMKISFSDLSSAGTGPGTSINKKYSDRPEYIFSTDKLPKETPSGRYSDENYDVIHFRVTFVICTKDFLRFIQQLCTAREHKYLDKEKQTHTYKHNQVTVLDASIKSVDMKSQNHYLYRYGDDNVSEVELTCEYLFNKKGYDDIMPQTVKDTLSSSQL